MGALAALFLFSGAAAADLPKPVLKLRLYPQGQQTDLGIVENGRAVTLGPGVSNGLSGEVTDRGGSRFGNIGDQAWIEIFLPEQCGGQMVVVCPGGGYSYCSYEGEGAWVADWCLRRGIAVCVVLYRMPNGHGEAPLTDVQNAFRYCRAHAAEWGVRRIGVMGFSAGGHLAAATSTMFTDGVTRPDFSVLVYPVITLEAAATHGGTRSALLGAQATQEQVEAWSPDRRVTAQTPPALLLLSADDRAVPPQNSIGYFEALQRHGVSGEMHIFTSGGHGWGFGTVETTGRDALGDQRAVLSAALERWLSAQLTD